MRAHEFVQVMMVGIPAKHLTAVEERARAAERAVERVDGYRPLDVGARVLAGRVIRRAQADYAAGLLEVRV